MHEHVPFLTAHNLHCTALVLAHGSFANLTSSSLPFPPLFPSLPPSSLHPLPPSSSFPPSFPPLFPFHFSPPPTLSPSTVLRTTIRRVYYLIVRWKNGKLLKGRLRGDSFALFATISQLSTWHLPTGAVCMWALRGGPPSNARMGRIQSAKFIATPSNKWSQPT